MLNLCILLRKAESSSLPPSWVAFLVGDSTSRQSSMILSEGQRSFYNLLELRLGFDALICVVTCVRMAEGSSGVQQTCPTVKSWQQGQSDDLLDTRGSHHARPLYKSYEVVSEHTQSNAQSIATYQERGDQPLHDRFERYFEGWSKPIYKTKETTRK